MSSDAAGFAGDLAAFGLADLIQTIALGGRSGRILVRSGGARGELWFREGALVHSEAGPLAGEPAVYRMLSWKEGSFRVEYGVESDRRSIEQDATVLVLEGLRRLDEQGLEETPRPRPSPPPAPPVRRQRRRRRPRATAGTVAILAAAVTAVAWIAAARESTRPIPPVPGRLSLEIPTAEPSVPDLPAPEPQTPSRPPTARSRVESPAPVTLPEEELDAYLEPPAPVTLAPFLASSPIAKSAATGSLRLEVKSWVADGSVRVLVDDEIAFSRSLSRQRSEFSRAVRRIVAAGDERFDAEIPVVPGAREVVVEVDLGEGAGIHREAALVVFQEGAPRTLRLTAGKAMGEPVRVRFD